MDSTVLQFLIWFPAIFLSIVGILWYFSFPNKQRKHHNAEALGLIALGLVISIVMWSFWLIYDIKGSDEMKVAFADKVIMGVMIGTFGSLSAIAVVTLIAVYKGDQFKRKGKTNSRKNTKKK
jgi:membrane protease YdiL (CAAX protease family)